MFDPSAIVDYLATLALNNGEAYRNGRNVQQAIQQAKRELIVEFTQLLNEISNQAADEVNAEWFEDEIKAAESQALRGFWPLVDAGQTVEVYPLSGCYPTGIYLPRGKITTTPANDSFTSSTGSHRNTTANASPYLQPDVAGPLKQRAVAPPGATALESIAKLIKGIRFNISFDF